MLALPEWSERTSVGVPLPSHDAGIDLVAVKHDGPRVAILCKTRSGDGSVTTKHVQQFAGAAPSSVFAERWMVAEARRSAATEDPAAVADVTFLDFEASLAEARDEAREREPSATEPDPGRRRSLSVAGVEAVPILASPEWLDSASLRRFQWIGLLAEGKRLPHEQGALPHRPREALRRLPRRGQGRRAVLQERTSRLFGELLRGRLPRQLLSPTSSSPRASPTAVRSCAWPRPRERCG